MKQNTCTIKSIIIKNYRSFNSSINKIEGFKSVNILIGRNSSGKSNFVNALRIAFGRGLDHGIRGKDTKIRIHDFNNSQKPISIQIGEDNPLIIDPLKDNEDYIELPQYDDDRKIKLFPSGPNRLFGNCAKSQAIPGDDAENWKLMQEKWKEIRNDMIYFGIVLDSVPPEEPKSDYFLENTLDENKVPLIEIGSGNVELINFVFDILKQIDRGCHIFLFEEPETHMHPELQRKFLQYLIDLSKKKSAQFIITTHSAIFIDQSVLRNESCSIYKVRKDEDGDTKIENIADDNEAIRNLLFNELGYKSSDILQANGIIWVEGPSDRIYINKWLELWTSKNKKRKYEEGIEYVIVPYGGSLKNYDFYEDADRKDNLIKAIMLNHNYFVVIDRDTEGEGKENWDKTKWKNKSKFIETVKNENVWLTDKNAIVTIKRVDKETNEEIEKIGSTIEGYLPDDIRNEFQTKGYRDKVKFAKKCELKIESLDKHDLNSQIEKIYKKIESWN